MEHHGQFDDQAATEPIQREAGYDQGQGYGYGYPQHQQQQGYGYGGPGLQQWGGRSRFFGGGNGGGYGQRGSHEVETKPFFLTSEFLGTALAIIAIAITAAVMDNLGARLTWILITAMVCAYVVSRGIAKSGTKSRAYDPREDLFRGDGASHERQQETVGSR